MNPMECGSICLLDVATHNPVLDVLATVMKFGHTVLRDVGRWHGAQKIPAQEILQYTNARVMSPTDNPPVYLRFFPYVCSQSLQLWLLKIFGNASMHGTFTTIDISQMRATNTNIEFKQPLRIIMLLILAWLLFLQILRHMSQSVCNYE
jgi:hypothetical protein